VPFAAVTDMTRGSRFAPTPPMLPDRDARIGWLFDRWQEVDRWVDAARQERTDPTTTPP
jgi:hypothetical protein